MLSLDIIPVAMDEAVSDIRKRIMSVESDITRWQQRQNQNNNFTANIPYDLEQMRSETKEFMDDLMSRDQRMMLALVTLTHLADNLEQLDQDTEALQAIGRARGCQFNILRYQQEDALNTVLPLGLKRIDATRSCVERNLRTLVQACWRQPDHSLLECVAGSSLTQPPTNTQFIDMLSAYLRE